MAGVTLSRWEMTCAVVPECIHLSFRDFLADVAREEPALIPTMLKVGVLCPE